MTERLASAAARHPGRTVGAWVAAIVVAFVLIALFLGNALTGEAEQLNNPESEQGYDLIAERVPPTPDFTTDVVLIRSHSVPVADPRFRAKISEVRQRLQSTPGALYVSDRPAAQTRDAAVIETGLEDDSAGDNVIDLVRDETVPPFEVLATGDWTFDTEQSALSLEDLRKGELQFGLPVAFVVLLLVFGAVVAGLVPVGLALTAIITALALVGLVGIFTELSIFTVNMLTGMGLALGIDYALFIVSRFREERTNGRDKLDAIVFTAGTANRAVLFSGLAFVIAMFGLLLIPNSIFRSLAAGAILVGVMSVAAALTLLPAVLSLLGDSRDEQSLDAVRELREEEIPGARVLVTGESAESIDYFALTDTWLPILIAFVLTLSFILLTVAFRSIVVAAKAIVLNLLSVGAAYGVLILVFVMGFGVAVSLLLDATIIRSVLLPSAMKLLGERNWYLPRALHWLPDFHVEGAR